VKLNHPIAVGCAILDISKTLLYPFHYKVMKARFDDGVKVILSDTDSIMYVTRGVDILKFMGENMQYFDTSNFPTTHELYDGSRARELGLWKSETGGDMISASYY